MKRTYEFAVLWISNIPFEAGHLVVMTFSLQLLLITTMKGSFIFSHRPLGEELAKALLLLEVLYITRAVYMSKTTKVIVQSIVASILDSVGSVTDHEWK